MAEKKENNDISKLSFEQAIKKLTDIVSKIEDGQISLEQSLSQYEQGMELIKHCRTSCKRPKRKSKKYRRKRKNKENHRPRPNPQF